MKKVARINPELEYEQAKKLIELASQQMLEKKDLSTLGSSVDNLMTAARVLMEREERRRGAPKPPPSNNPKGRQKGESREESKKLPSQKYLDLPIEEEFISPPTPPACPCCQHEMAPSGLYDVSEKLEVTPKKYFIKKVSRVKFNCTKCHGHMANTPALPSIVPTSNYGDSLIIDVALSKFCSLIPIERYAEIARQQGLGGEIPAQSLIGLTHHLANFLELIYQKIKQEVLDARVLMADETPHKMLEGDKNRNWFLWGFFSSHSCYFEAHDTRSGDKAIDFLKDSKAEYLLTDGYQGYAKALKHYREAEGRVIQEAHCNAHAFRYFEEAALTWKDEAEPFLKIYGKIYGLERDRKLLGSDSSMEDHLKLRSHMMGHFEELKKECLEKKDQVMSKSHLEKAINYFLGHFEGLTRCTRFIEIPLDNNLAEREFRAYVVGRKTWIGTHSKRGALTASILFTLVHSCKLSGVNPYHYFPWVVGRLHGGEDPLTPLGYSKIMDS